MGLKLLNFIINNLQPDGLLTLKLNNGHFVHQKFSGFLCSSDLWVKGGFGFSVV